MTPAEQKIRLWEIFNFLKAGRIPLGSYTLLHPEARVSKTDLAVIKKYVSKFSVTPIGNAAAIKKADLQCQEWFKTTDQQ